MEYLFFISVLLIAAHNIWLIHRNQNLISLNVTNTAILEFLLKWLEETSFTDISSQATKEVIIPEIKKQIEKFHKSLNY